jgi:hypothetical protein
MAQVPYEHIEATEVIRIDGVRAFNIGDPIPLDTARRLGLLDGDDAPPIIGGDGSPPSAFTDSALTVTEQAGEQAPGTTSETTATTPADAANEAASTVTGTTPATPTQATGQPRSRGNAAPTTP